MDARRYVYRLTHKGIDLAPVLIEMIIWSATHEDTAASDPDVRRFTTQRDSVIRELRAQLAA